MNQCWEWFAWYSSWEFVVYNWYQCPANHHAIIEEHTTAYPPTTVSASDVYDYNQYNQHMCNYNQHMYGYYAEQSSHQTITKLGFTV